MTSDSLARFMHHVRSMRQLTNVELVNTYWQQAHQIAKTGRLGFIISGNLSWESKNSQGVSGSSNIWLKSNRNEPAGKHIAEEPVRTYLQWYMNIYEIWGTLAIRIDPNDASASKPLIEKASPALQEAINYATTVYERCRTSKKGSTEEAFPVIALYLHIIQMTDSIEVLVSNCCPTPANLLLRSSFEAKLSLQSKPLREIRPRGRIGGSLLFKVKTEADHAFS